MFLQFLVNTQETCGKLAATRGVAYGKKEREI
jgi:hypothetical protein